MTRPDGALVERVARDMCAACLARSPGTKQTPDTIAFLKQPLWTLWERTARAALAAVAEKEG